MTWRNWAGNQRGEPVEVASPQSADEVAAIVKQAATAGRRVKPIGSGHSFTGIGLTDGVQLSLSRLSGLVSVDRSSGLVTVEAGMPLYQLNPILEKSGLSLSNLGDIDRQTVAGALSTGTHGTGRKQGGLATQIRAMQMVLATGEVVTCNATERPELFTAARVGLGALGVLTSITLQAEKTFALSAKERPMALEDVVSNLDELVQDNDHFEFFWFPHTQQTLTKCNNRLAAGEPTRPLGRRRAVIEDEILSNGVFQLTCSLGRVAPGMIPRINKYAARALGDREYADTAHRVFVSPRRVRFVEMEYAVPRAAVKEALAGIAQVIEKNNLHVSFPVEVRFAAADDIPLSTGNGRESAYLAIHMFRGQPFDTYFHAVESLMNTLEGRPHWGKMHYQDAETLRTRYPHFDEFVDLRNRLDPNGLFTNDYLDRVLGPPSSRL